MQDFIDKLKDNVSFIEFEEYVIGKVNELDSVQGLIKLNDKKAGEEAKLRERTKKKVIEIFSPFINFVSKKEITEDQIQEAKDKNLL